MSLPAPTVSGMDVNQERLRDVERRRTAPLPNIAAAAKDAIVVSNAVTEMTENERKRKEAQDFQKNYVDKGWEGYEKAWNEAGAPPEAAPQIVRTAVGDAPVTAFKYLGEIVQKKENKAKAAGIAGAAKAGKSSTELAAMTGDAGLIVETAAKAEERAGKALEKDAERVLREQIKKDDREWDKTMATFRAGLDRDTKAGKATTQIKDDLTELNALSATRAGYAGKRRLTDTDKIEYADVVRQMSIIKDRIARAKKEGAVAPKGGTETPPPPAATTVWRTGPDGKTEYEYNAETRQPTGKSRPK